MSKGWHQEYERHALAGMGIKTGVKKLDTVKMGKKTYFIDSRLGQLRNIKNPHDWKVLDKDTEEAIAYSKVIKKFGEKKDEQEDFFKFDSRQTTREQMAMLKEIIKKYSNNTEVYEVGNNIYVNVKNISNYPDYIKDVSNYGYYNGLDKVGKKAFFNKVSDYDLRNDLLD
jgi:hypothetical protein